jgi:hypothetical protein
MMRWKVGEVEVWSITKVRSPRNGGDAGAPDSPSGTPLLVKPNGVILDGVQRWKSAVRAGRDSVRVQVVTKEGERDTVPACEA